MGVRVRQKWITGEEFGEERWKLIKAGLGDSPEMVALMDRVLERDDYLWEKYAKPLISEHPGKWAAVSLNGEILIRPTASAAISDGTALFGGGNFVYGRLAAFRGHQM